MSHPAVKKLLPAALALLVLWLGGKYLLPLVMPFLLGFLLALGAEPCVRLLSRHLRLKRGLAAFIGVSATLVLLLCAALLLFSFLVKELGALAGILPDLESTARQGLTALQDWLLQLASRCPEGIRSLLTRGVLGLFDSGSALYDQLISYVPGLATAFLSHIPDSALSLGTGILSAYLLSSRIPFIFAWLRGHLPRSWQERWLPALKNLKSALGGWFRAQLKLLTVTYLIVAAGLWLIGIAYAPVWAVLIALVDAVPLLGTGIILVPWSLIRFVQADAFQAFGLLAIYGASALTRSALEPRLLGKQLGLDPLATLVCLYLGYQLFGFPGMLLAPLAAVAALQLGKAATEER